MATDYNIFPTRIGSTRNTTNNSKNRIENKIKFNFLIGIVRGITKNSCITVEVEDGILIENVRPLMTSYFRHYPQVGEAVFVIYQSTSPNPNRAWWIGPIYASNVFSEPYGNSLVELEKSKAVRTKNTHLLESATDFIPTAYEYDPNSIYVVNRTGSTIQLSNEKTVIITSDILKHSKNEDVPNIEISDSSSSMTFESATMLLNSYDSHLGEGQSFATVYGERLVEILRWIIETLKTHRHGPHTAAYPDFHTKANEYTNNLTEDNGHWLINHNVRTR